MTTASPALPFLAAAETAELEDWGPLPEATGEPMRWLWFCIMIALPADLRTPRSVRARMTAWAEPATRRSRSLPSLERGTGPRPAGAACNPGATSRTPRCAGTGKW
jgi:hypothetical protein